MKDKKKYFKQLSSHLLVEQRFTRSKKKLVIPAIHWVFVTQRQLLFDDANGRGKIDLLGDGRCDSLGYNAKYGTYTVIDKQTGMIIDMHVPLVGVAGNSARMELDGLKNVIQGPYDNVINISSSKILFEKKPERYSTSAGRLDFC